MSDEMQVFMETEYQGSIYMMDGELSDIEVTVTEKIDEKAEEDSGETTEETEE